jgi:hypothetical protein
MKKGKKLPPGMQFEQQEIHVEETGPDFILESLEGFLVGAQHCDLSFVCAEKRVVKAHCAVVSAVSVYVRRILADVAASGANGEDIPVLLPDVSLADLRSFLELGKLRMLMISMEVQVSRLLNL